MSETINKDAEYREAVEILNGMGHDAEIYEGYSGCGMYGKETTGIVTSASGPMVGYAVVSAFVAQDNSRHPDDAEKLIPRRSDSMGRDAIYY